MKDLEILKNVCQDHGVSLFELLGPGRRQKIMEARTDASKKLSELGLSPREIGFILGGRDRTTIMNLLKK
jgi:chromosomal replication initiation ATPase DnaA